MRSSGPSGLARRACLPFVYAKATFITGTRGLGNQSRIGHRLGTRPFNPLSTNMYIRGAIAQMSHGKRRAARVVGRSSLYLWRRIRAIDGSAVCQAAKGAKARINSLGQQQHTAIISLVRRLFSKLIPPIKLTKLSAILNNLANCKASPVK